MKRGFVLNFILLVTGAVVLIYCFNYTEGKTDGDFNKELSHVLRIIVGLASSFITLAVPNILEDINKTDVSSRLSTTTKITGAIAVFCASLIF